MVMMELHVGAEKHLVERLRQSLPGNIIVGLRLHVMLLVP
jgi:hypothetical protein